MPDMTQLPTDADKRNAINDQSNQTAGPEQRKTLTRKQRKAETAAALGAAIIGQMFSKTSNVFIGTATTVDENRLFEKSHPRPPGAGSGSSGSAAVEPHEPAGQLLPWIKLDSGSGSDVK